MEGTPPVKSPSYSYSDVRHLTGDRAVSVKTNPRRYFEANSVKTPAFSVQVTAQFRSADGHSMIPTTLFMRPDVALAYHAFMLVEQVPMPSSAVPESARVITGAQKEFTRRFVPDPKGHQVQPLFRPKAPPEAPPKKPKE